jgi:hypothetical protein
MSWSTTTAYVLVEIKGARRFAYGDSRKLSCVLRRWVAAYAAVCCAVQAPYKGVFQKIGEMFQTS